MGTIMPKLVFHGKRGSVLDADLHTAPRTAGLGHTDTATSHASPAVGYTGEQHQHSVSHIHTHDQM